MASTTEPNKNYKIAYDKAYMLAQQLRMTQTTPEGYGETLNAYAKAKKDAEEEVLGVLTTTEVTNTDLNQMGGGPLAIARRLARARRAQRRTLKEHERLLSKIKGRTTAVLAA